MGIIITDLGDIRGKRPEPRPPIENFHRVDDKVYRGAQPTAAGLRGLKDLGVTTVIDLRDGDNWKGERSACDELGIVYNNIPLDPFAEPSEESLIDILTIIEKSEGKVFIHCQFGCDRTGTAMAIYRITKGETNQAALAEAIKHGLSEWETGMRKLIARFNPKDLL